MLTLTEAHQFYDGPVPRHLRAAAQAESRERRYADGMAEERARILRGSIITTEIDLGEHRRMMRYWVREFRRQPAERPRIRANIDHYKAMVRVLSARLADARIKLAEVPAATA